MSWLLILFIIILLIALNALYVAAEFSTASSRRSRLAQLADEGSTLARQVLPIVEKPVQLDTYIAACQIGITISSLALGFYGQSALSPPLASILESLGIDSGVASASISATLILIVLTVVQVLLGELVPKNIGIRYPEQLAMATVTPMRWFITIFRPLIWIFNGSGRLILRLIGVEPIAEHAHVHAPEEIRLLVQESGAGGLLNKEERQLLENTLEFRGQTVRQVMIPRTRIFAAPVTTPPDELFTTLARSPHSRMLLYQENLDHVEGTIHLLDLFSVSNDFSGHTTQELMHPVCFIPETLAVDRAFSRLQKARQHVAVALDEYGGTAGLVAMEDLIEEIVGDIQDEFDEDQPAIQRLTPDRVRVAGDVPVAFLNECLDLYLPSGEIETLGGLVLAAEGRVPAVGDVILVGELAVQVEAMRHNSVLAVSFSLPPEQLDRLSLSTDEEVRND